MTGEGGGNQTCYAVDASRGAVDTRCLAGQEPVSRSPCALLRD